MLLLVGLISILASCSTIAPRSSALNAVHDAYRNDFLELVQIPGPGEEVQSASASDAPYFDQTLIKIDNFRATFGTDSQEAAHLNVLEGMVYLQSGQFGLAALKQDDIQGSLNRLKSKTGSEARDYLFGWCFGPLLQGWSKMQQKVDDKDFAGITTAADLICERLNTKPERVSNSQHAGLYLATSAAIFYSNAFKHAKDQGKPYDAESKKIRYGNVLFVMRHYMDADIADQLASRGKALLADGGTSPDLVRFYRWYIWVQEEHRNL